MTQWHPIFVHLPRPVVEPFFEVRTTVPVGDMPREADIVLLQRLSAGAPPFRGLWRNLTTWNILEFKGRSVSPRVRDLDVLVELGLGIDRRLNEERVRRGQRLLAPEQVSFWYLTNHLGRRFQRRASSHFGGLEALGPGIWRWRVLLRPVFLISSSELAVESDTVPLHVVSDEPRETELEVARFTAGQPELWEQYGPWLAHLHTESWKEVRHMAKVKRKRSQPSWEPLFDAMEEDKQLEEYVLGKIFEEKRLREYFKKLSPAERKRMKKLLESGSDT